LLACRQKFSRTNDIRRFPQFLLRLFTVIFLVVFLVPGGFAKSQTAELRQVTAVVLENLPPYYFNLDGKPAGLAVDILSKIAPLAGLDVNYLVVTNWEDGYKAIKSGAADIFPNVDISDKRQSFLDFSVPYDVFFLSLFMRSGAVKLNNINELSGKILGAQEATILTKKLKSNKKFIVKEFKTFNEAFFALLTGGVDAVLAPNGMFQKIAKETGFNDHIVRIEKPLREVKRAMAVKKGNKVLLRSIDVALEKFKRTPDYKRIMNKWYGAPKLYWTGMRVFLVMVGLLLGIIIIAGGWRYLLHRKLLKTETDLSQSEQRFRDFAEASSDWFWEMDADLRFTYFSQKLEEITGHKTADWIGKTRWEYIDMPQENKNWVQHMEDLEARRPFRNFVFYLKKGEEQGFYVNTNGVPVYNHDGTFSGYRGSSTDITEQKKAEEKRRLSEERLNIAMAASKAGYWMRDVPLTSVFWSDENYRLLGYEPGEVEASYANWVIRIHPDDREETVQALKRCIYDKTDINLEYRVVHPNGRIAWLSNIGKNLVGLDGQSRVLAGVQTDISERKDLEHQLRQSQRMEAVGQLTGGVAHDFNNLLAIMLGNAELLKHTARQDDIAAHQISTILRAIDRAASLTSRLLSFSRKQALSPKTTNISKLLVGLNDMLFRTLGETIAMKVVAVENVWPVLIDPHQLENALVNLSLNARDAMPNGGVLTIECKNVSLDETYTKNLDEVASGDYICVAVSDNGTGMTKDVQEKVFEPFFTTKDVGKGSGLGLSMVYGFVIQSGGHIAVYSELGEGTTIKLYLPRSKDGAKSVKKTSVTPDIPLGTEHILVVEDDDGVREIPVSMLKSRGYQVTEARDGLEAIGLLKQGPSFDLLFTDVVLPGGINGVDIAEEALRFHPEIKILYTTGYSEKAVIHDGKLGDDVVLLSKPYRQEELLQNIRNSLDKT